MILRSCDRLCINSIAVYIHFVSLLFCNCVGSLFCVAEFSLNDLGNSSVKKPLKLSPSLVRDNTCRVEEVESQTTSHPCPSVCDTNQFDWKSFEIIEDCKQVVESQSGEEKDSMCEFLRKNEKSSIEFNPMSSIKVENVRSLCEYVEDSKVWYSNFQQFQDLVRKS